jgi:hypothetical protein
MPTGPNLQLNIKKLLCILVLALSAVGAVALYLSVFGTSRITCQITNVSGGRVTTVAVIVGGNHFAMGTLESGESRRVTLSPINVEGGVELVFDDAEGIPASHFLDGYVERQNYRGTVHAEIGQGGTVRIVSNSIGPSLF